jgi:hypothetical protein
MQLEGGYQAAFFAEGFTTHGSTDRFFYRIEQPLRS